ncbi:MAG TPA: hypothetical protein VG168_00470 [Bryobacteraceae bacterium]|jgi:hypothetical protein|nr:hypothetical protein [Bryobacteraceae bacterium]
MHRAIPATIDIFHDREERVANAAQADAALLQEHSYTLEWQRREPAIYALLASRFGERTKLEWVVDSDFRFSRLYGMKRSAIFCTRLTSLRIKWERRMGVESRGMLWTY